MQITEKLIPHIEKASGSKLYNNQVNYLLGKGCLNGKRKSGKTFAYCVKLALSEGEPLDLSKPEEFSDYYGKGSFSYAETFFKSEFIRIRTELEGYGFTVREVKNI